MSFYIFWFLLLFIIKADISWYLHMPCIILSFSHRFLPPLQFKAWLTSRSHSQTQVSDPSPCHHHRAILCFFLLYVLDEVVVIILMMMAGYSHLQARKLQQRGSLMLLSAQTGYVNEATCLALATFGVTVPITGESLVLHQLGCSLKLLTILVTVVFLLSTTVTCNNVYWTSEFQYGAPCVSLRGYTHEAGLPVQEDARFSRQCLLLHLLPPCKSRCTASRTNVQCLPCIFQFGRHARKSMK